MARPSSATTPKVPTRIGSWMGRDSQVSRPKIGLKEGVGCDVLMTVRLAAVRGVAGHRRLVRRGRGIVRRSLWSTLARIGRRSRGSGRAAASMLHVIGDARRARLDAAVHYALEQAR